MLRPARAEDFEEIATIWHQGWRDGHLGHIPQEIEGFRTLEDFRARVPERADQTIVATIDSRVVGFVTVHEDEVEQVYVAAEARGGETATSLLEHAEQLISKRFDLAWLAVVAGNARARRFYSRSGWVDAGEYEYAAQAGEGTFTVRALRYEKRLT